jgi:poly-gamma-glutamate synthase PgsB/CapB
MLFTTLILFLVISLLIVEKTAVQRSVETLELRIHVNGTRGKSSVTEYIAAGLLNTQTDVMAKVTGIVPTILHNGVEQPIRRVGGARVQEQMNLIRFASKKKVRSLILECMSISPELQRLESRFFKPHIYVITNIKDDHREEMGRDPEEQANSICGAIPENCTVITNEIRFLEKIKERAALRNSVVITPQELDSEFHQNLPSGIFPENVRLALTACMVAGVDLQLAQEGIRRYLSGRSSALTRLSDGKRQIMFLNAFAVNDVDSTALFIEQWKEKLGNQGKITLVFNTRSDRPIRTDLFTGWCKKSISTIENIIVTGDHAMRANHSLLKSGFDKEKIHIWSAKQVENAKSGLFEIAEDGALVVGIGNIGEAGFTFLKGIA